MINLLVLISFLSRSIIHFHHSSFKDNVVPFFSLSLLTKTNFVLQQTFKRNAEDNSSKILLFKWWVQNEQLSSKFYCSVEPKGQHLCLPHAKREASSRSFFLRLWRQDHRILVKRETTPNHNNWPSTPRVLSHRIFANYLESWPINYAHAPLNCEWRSFT